MASSARASIGDLRAAVRLLSRLPVDAGAEPVGNRPPDALRFAPVVGAGIACAQAAVIAGLAASGVPLLAAAASGLVVSLCLTGALHEDGLADVADGFGGGATRERKLAIMRDSRIGTFGAAALGCSLLMRAACLSALAGRGPVAVLAALLVAAPASRALMLLPLALLRPARSDGLGQSLTSGARRSTVWAIGLALLLAGAIALLAPLSPPRLVAALGAAAAASLILTDLARRQIGGMTGDVAGATQQVAEIAALLVLSAG